MAQKISNLAVGAKVKITGSKYGGTGSEYEMIVAAKNHSGYSGGVVLVPEFAVKFCAFDAKEPSNTKTVLQTTGNARYAHSNLLQWLNSDWVPWYAAKHTYDQEPAEGFVSQNPYSDQRGFKSHFPAAFNSLLLDIPAVSIIAGTTNRETVTTKWAIPSVTEILGTAEVADGSEGSQFSYFAIAANRKCTLNTGMSIASDYYTRTPKAETDGASTRDYELVTIVANTGERDTAYPQDGECFVRPFCLLSNDALVTDTTTNGYYGLLYNTVPMGPTSITVPAAVNGGTNIPIKWSAGADVDGNLAGYVLERSVDGGNWSQIYSGALREFIDAITFGWVSVAYRVKAYDAYDAQSGYTTSETRIVVNNKAPTISGSDGSLGSFTTAFTTQTYSISDADGDSVTVVEQLDGNVRRTYAATLGNANSFGFTEAEWQQVLNGLHTIVITVTDSKGRTAVRTWTFTKAVSTFTFAISPLPADAMPDRCAVSVAGNFPAGSVLKIEVCNNANDVSPKWEDISSKLGKKHFFSNAAKTAVSWAFGLRCTLTRGTAAGAVWLDHITINYR